MSCWKKPNTDHTQIEPPNDIKELFDKEYSEKEVMSFVQFKTFLSESQGENMSIDDIKDKIIKHLDLRRITQQTGLRLGDFFTYLFGDLNFPLSQEVYQDMKSPLAHYFISTRVKIRLFSPRKGLLNASRSKRNYAAIKEALKMGVRVLQLDLSYNLNEKAVSSSHEEVDIRGALKTYMETIRDHAFSTNKFPVIISCEGDFDSKMQSRVAQMAKAIFADKLHNPTEQPQDILTPASLTNKILLTHPQTYHHEIVEEEEGTRAKRESTRNGTLKLDNTVQDEDFKSLITISDVKLGRSLSEILAAKYDNICCLKMTQPKLENITSKHGAQIVEFTQRNLLAVNPVDKLSGSSNCNPLTGWSHGAQMVAVNGQGHDKYLGVTQGMFRANGGCGYVKKPEILLNDKIFDPNANLPHKSTLKVMIYMGDGWHLDFSAINFDVLSAPDFFLKVQLVGVQADCKKKETQLVENNWRPVWNQEFDFPLTVPDLAFLRIEARDFDEDRSHAFGGQTCLPVRKLKGIRTVPLYNKRGKMYQHVRLLARFQLIDH